ncbi:sugar ABC transporter ATP-binding protein [Taklimakanibacter deserti]|uniref:sugar ABC transporter ATP-binding protein n=1 Tax=Taklimakanibacter deserti TaxID=2267839 RepID=UPI000E6559E3
MFDSSHAGASAARPFLSAASISKAFGGAQALKGVSIEVRNGEVHGLVGANGAGKSTLIRVLAGLVQPDGGEIRIDGTRVSIETPHRASQLGMSFIHQDLALVPTMTVIENIMLGLPKKTRFGLVDWPAIAGDVKPIAERVGLRVPLDVKVRHLSTAESWLVSICRALVHKARLIVMDEPTASLSASECERLFAIIRDLAASGVAVLYVSHRLSEILSLCQRVSVFRDGASVACHERAKLSREMLVEAIVGHSEASAPSIERKSAKGAPVLSVSGLTRQPKVNGVSFTLHQGEVLGIGGLVGSGRSELARLVYGADRIDSGAMTMNGKAFAPRHSTDAFRAGIGLVPEERRAEGLLLTKSVAFNLSLANLASLCFSSALPVISAKKRNQLAQDTVRELAIKTAGINAPVGRLSGGNQQKVVIGRWLRRAPQILILDEPTRGVDIGARAEIHRLIRALAGKGMAVLVISSESDELPDLCDRVLVMADGRIVAELEGQGISRSSIVAASYADKAA